MSYPTVDEVAEQLHLTPDGVRRMAAEGRIPARKVGRRWLFHPDLIDKYVRGEWQSSNEKPAALGGLESQYAVSLFADPPRRSIEAAQRNSKPRSVPATGGKRN